MARILVTGASGFIGAAVTEALARRGDTVAAFDIAVSPALARICARYPHVQAVPGEITEWPHVAAALREARPEAVVHCAAIVGVVASLDAPFATLRVNVGGALNLMEAMRLFGVRRLVNLSSEEIYGPFERDLIDEDHPCRPTLPYGISKFAAEQLARDQARLHGLDAVHVRTCWVYGPGLPRPRVPKILIEAAAERRPLHLEEGGDFRVDHVYIDDLVAGILAVLDRPRHRFDAYHIATGEAPSLAEMVAIVKELVPGAELSVGPGPYRMGGRVELVRKGALDIARARAELSYAPRFDIRAGLEAYLRAWRAGQA